MAGRLIAIAGRYSGAAVSGASRGKPRGTPSRSDLEDGGTGRIAATVKQIGTPNTPVWRRVRLFERSSGRLIRETWSDPVTGAYEFSFIKLGREYTVVGYDHTGQYNAVIADPIVAEAM